MVAIEWKHSPHLVTAAPYPQQERYAMITMTLWLNLNEMEYKRA